MKRPLTSRQLCATSVLPNCHQVRDGSHEAFVCVLQNAEAARLYDEAYDAIRLEDLSIAKQKLWAAHETDPQVGALPNSLPENAEESLARQPVGCLCCFNCCASLAVPGHSRILIDTDLQEYVLAWTIYCLTQSC